MKIFVLLLIFFISSTAFAQSPPQPGHCVEAGWCVFDGFRLGYSYSIFYLGTNISFRPNTALVEKADEERELNHSGVKIQPSIGLQYIFRKHSEFDLRHGIRFAWAPTFLTLRTRDHSPSGDYPIETSWIYKRRPPSETKSERTIDNSGSLFTTSSYDLFFFDISWIIAMYNKSFYFVIGVTTDFDSFFDSRVHLSAGYSFPGEDRIFRRRK